MKISNNINSYQSFKAIVTTLEAERILKEMPSNDYIKYLESRDIVSQMEMVDIYISSDANKYLNAKLMTTNIETNEKELFKTYKQKFLESKIHFIKRITSNAKEENHFCVMASALTRFSKFLDFVDRYNIHVRKVN